jgi:hypothetical protein
MKAFCAALPLAGSLLTSASGLTSGRMTLSASFWTCSTVMFLVTSLILTTRMMPEPPRVIVSGLPAALWLICNTPLKPPALGGSNLTLMVHCAEGGKVLHVLLAREKPVPVTETPVIETAAVPVLVNVTLETGALPT